MPAGSVPGFWFCLQEADTIKIWTDFLTGKYRLCVSTEILLEYEEILSVHASPEVAHNVVEAIARHPQTYYRESYYRFHLMRDIDEDDNKFVDCAFAAGADYLVSEDSHFNVLRRTPFPQLNLVTLDEFMQNRIISPPQHN